MADSRSNINDIWNTFKQHIFKQHLFKCLYKHIPSKIIKSNNRLPWFNHKIKKMLRKKQSLYNQAKRTKNWSNYKHYQKECKRQIRKGEWNYINSAILEGMEKNNTKPFWKYVKSRKQDNIGVAPLKERGHLIDNSKEKAQILIKQFSSVFTREKVNKMPKTRRRIQQNIPNIKITQDGVAKLLRSINPSKASGPDNIPNSPKTMCRPPGPCINHHIPTFNRPW
jgi:hypothetical protein